MKLFYGSASGFSRKVRMIIHEIGLIERVELALVRPQKDVETLSEANPLGKIPALFSEGIWLYDFSVICEYLITNFGTPQLLPSSGAERWMVLRRASLGDGVLEAAMLARAAKSSGVPNDAAYEWQMGKVRRGFDELERTVPTMPSDLDLGGTALVCAIGWLQFRMPDLDVLKDRPKTGAWYSAISERPSFRSTMPFE